MLVVNVKRAVWKNMNFSKSNNNALNAHLRHICADQQNHTISISLFGECLKRICHNCAWDPHQTMKCRSFDVPGMRKCAWGERLKHIVSVAYFHEINICYVYNGQSDIRKLCHQQCTGFILHFINKRAAARGFYRRCLENGRGNHTIINICRKINYM